MKRWDQWFAWSIAMLAFQFLVLDHLQVYGYLNPYIYVGIIISAPARWPVWAHVAVATVLGAFMDFHYLSGGLHLMACTLMAAMRPRLLGLVLPRAEEEDLAFGIADIGLGKWLTYALATIAVHHIWLFFWGSISLNFMMDWLYRALLSSLATGLALTSLAALIPSQD
jgi:hypothetical protein